MKLILPLLICLLLSSFTGWNTNFDTAKTQATASHKFILLNFSGSDWCGPCIRMEKEVFASADFKAYADSNMILVNADFPRQKKNALSKQQQQQNEKLADQYNPQGSFPYTLLLNEKGEKIKEWNGYQKVQPADFIAQIKTATTAK